MISMIDWKACKKGGLAFEDVLRQAFICDVMALLKYGFLTIHRDALYVQLVDMQPCEYSVRLYARK
jgi:hypothetical protein